MQTRKSHLKLAFGQHETFHDGRGSRTDAHPAFLELLIDATAPAEVLAIIQHLTHKHVSRKSILDIRSSSSLRSDISKTVIYCHS
jgi:hypothetical protein